MGLALWFRWSSPFLFFVSCPLFGLMDNGRCQNVFRYISMYIQLDNVFWPIPYAVRMWYLHYQDLRRKIFITRRDFIRMYRYRLIYLVMVVLLPS